MPAEARSHALQVLVSQSERDAIATLAALEQRSVSAMLRVLVLRSLAQAEAAHPRTGWVDQRTKA